MDKKDQPNYVQALAMWDPEPILAILGPGDLKVPGASHLLTFEKLFWSRSVVKWLARSHGFNSCYLHFFSREPAIEQNIRYQCTQNRKEGKVTLAMLLG